MRGTLFAPQLLIRWLCGLTFLPLLAGCGHFSQEQNQLQAREFHLRPAWIRSAEREHLLFRKINRFPPLIAGDRLIQGNSLNGISAFDISSGDRLWHIPVENGVEGGADFIRDRLFFGGSDGQFYSAKISTGEIVWTFPTRMETLSAPKLHQGVVYFLSGNNVFYALDAATGRQQWIYTRTENLPLSVRGGSRPAIQGDHVVVGFSDGAVVSLHRETGRVLWERQINRNPRFRDVDTDPVIDGDRVYIAGFDGSLYALNVRTGDEVWRYDQGGYGGFLIHGDLLYYPTSDGKLLALDKNSGRLRWLHEVRRGIATRPALHRGMLIYGDSGGSLVFLDGRSGRQVAEYEPGRGIFSPPTVHEASGKVFFISNEGNTYALRTGWQKRAEQAPWLRGAWHRRNQAADTSSRPRLRR